MTDQHALLNEYWPLIIAELTRIGFTDEDVRWVSGWSGTTSHEALEGYLTELRGVPSGIGTDAFFARQGIDYPAVRRELSELPPHTAPPNER